MAVGDENGAFICIYFAVTSVALCNAADYLPFVM
jgi:hypothetical protein